MIDRLLNRLSSVPFFLKPFLGLLILAVVIVSSPIWAPILIGYCFYWDLVSRHSKGGIL